MHEFLALALASFVAVSGRAFQSLNVTQHRNAFAVYATAGVIALAEVTAFLRIVSVGELWAAVPIAIGGGTGCVVAMRLHKRAFGYESNDEKRVVDRPDNGVDLGNATDS